MALPNLYLKLMPVLHTLNELRPLIATWRGGNQRIACVPTMGNLHAGHLQLVKEARQHADRVIVSLFVNPLQFGLHEDFERYPRTLQQDQALLDHVGVDGIWAPAVTTLYPMGLADTTRIEIPELADILCGAHRPGHFSGVATVVTKLFNAMQPDVAFFGAKDFQQVLIIRRITRELLFPVEIVTVDTVRDSDGLALSSRNSYLSPKERGLAPQLYRVLQEVAQQLAQGARDHHALEQAATHTLTQAGFRVDYVAIRGTHNLMPPAPEQGADTLIVLGAAWLGETRLIDNVQVEHVTVRG